MVKMMEKLLDMLPLAAAGGALVALACVFSASLRETLRQADLDLLAGAVALLPLVAALLAFSLGAHPRRQQRREAIHRSARLHATYDIDPRG
ncbi:hypothetical protein [Herbaspirillum sp. YR522]|uniref:hypothetical protein n=1 Tax=Herbaspirillum sp. YR522 TaxID=1144342 RepID=UPI00026F64D9|nr:hypothetical protein [Herbaspirillum sp. YR522]EJN09348.1 hypothetical protein PMI40_00795 [Herbaspirillum sp. YR522]